MFTGIVEEVGEVKQIRQNGTSGSIRIQGKQVLQGTNIGDSIAVNGVCLTVTNLWEDVFEADIMAETMRYSALCHVAPGDVVNLERAMQLGGRLGGHIVTGHIDGVGKIRRIIKEENAIWYEVEVSRALRQGIVKKGSISLDGISLTVAELREDAFLVSVIPHTREVTALSQRMVGDAVNIETDVIGKYVQQFMGKQETTLTYEMLMDYGF